ncbi:acyltransferase family protein [Compostimonas suwonensis]|uniref:Surface polysaccharide O-acyltransferase-like enzyme n=1 Tax=Compostimonas suwonensis TaxID=1048394 RepID=A0A2M9BCC6_9MICO|nr:acyltransferase [Compostimonas suwonensis]PJJ55562.1 surface polysaccharide O-acyltransferase-like enzyme [Compostimonas suwonensis]
MNLDKRVRAQDRHVWMDLLRGLAILLVILDHAADQVTSNTGSPLFGVTTFNDAISPFRMATLMFLSGFLLPRSLAKPHSEFVFGKLGRIGWPYLVWSGVILGLIAATSSLSGNTSVDLHQVLRIFYNPPSYLWYLAYLLIFYLVSLFLPTVVRSLLIPVALVASQLLQDQDEWQRMLFLFSFFLAGDLIARSGNLLGAMVVSWPVMITASLIATTTAAFAALKIPVRYEAIWAPGTAAGVLILVALSMLVQSRPFGRWVAKYGQHSIVFYVTHWSAILITFNVLVRVGVSNIWVLFFASLAAGLFVGFLFVWAQRRWQWVGYLFHLPLVSLWRSLRGAKTQQSRAAE